MVKEFESLNNSEIELLLKTPMLVCILIAGADGSIDRKEIKGAIELAQKKQRKGRAALLEYYQIMAEDFEDKLKITIQSYPNEVKRREEAIVAELAELNHVLPKLPVGFASEFYNSMKGIALNIAESSGGILGMNKVGEHEERYINLPMIKQPGL